MEEISNFLIDGNIFRPAGGFVTAALDVTGEQFVGGQQAADAAHVAVAVAANFIGDAFEGERFIFKWFERRQDPFQLEVSPGLVGPEVGGNGAVRGEHEDDSLPWAGRGRLGQRRQGGKKRQDRGGKAEAVQKLAAGSDGHDGGAEWKMRELGRRRGGAFSGWLEELGWG